MLSSIKYIATNNDNFYKVEDFDNEKIFQSQSLKNSTERNNQTNKNASINKSAKDNTFRNNTNLTEKFLSEKIRIKNNSVFLYDRNAKAISFSAFSSNLGGKLIDSAV